ncbi:MAG: hypothetical protein AAGA58_20445 [Verrucomicrobiota bacterium]
MTIIDCPEGWFTMDEPELNRMLGKLRDRSQGQNGRGVADTVISRLSNGGILLPVKFLGVVTLTLVLISTWIGYSVAVAHDHEREVISVPPPLTGTVFEEFLVIR